MLTISVTTRVVVVTAVVFFGIDAGFELSFALYARLPTVQNVTAPQSATAYAAFSLKNIKYVMSFAMGKNPFVISVFSVKLIEKSTCHYITKKASSQPFF